MSSLVYVCGKLLNKDIIGLDVNIDVFWFQQPSLK